MSPRLLSALLVLALAPPVVHADRQEKGSAQLQGFYVVREAISDAAPFWFTYVLEVSPRDEGTAVRYIRVAPLNAWCDTVTVKAATRNLKHRTPKKLAGSGDPCPLSTDEFYRALDESSVGHGVSLFDTARWNIVASCGETEKVFHFPYPEEIDMDRLKKRSPRVIALWNLESRIAKAAFGKQSVFYEISQERDLELQHLGAQLLPELRSGRFDKGFHDSCASPRSGSAQSAAFGAAMARPCSPHPMENLLSGYRGPIQSREPSAKLMNADELHFLSFELPEYPPLAKMARIQGEVVLSVTVNQDTGDVKEVTSVSGHPLLAKSALTVAHQWRFDPKTQDTSPPIRVLLKYAFNCP